MASDQQPTSSARIEGARVVALAGGVGAARFLAGLVRAVPPEDVAAIVNTGDDMRFYGVHVSPDVDIVTYTLAGRVDRARGYGLEGDTTAVLDALGALGHETWFRLGDRDFAALPSPHAAARAKAWGSVPSPTSCAARRASRRASSSMSEDPCPTHVLLDGRAQRPLRGISRARRRSRRRGGRRPLRGVSARVPVPACSTRSRAPR